MRRCPFPPLQEYYDRFNYILDRGFKMVVFMPYEFKSHLHIQDDRVTIVHFPSEDIKNYFPYYDRVEEVRLSPLWVSQGVQTGWLGKSPQAKLPGYNPLVMSKVYLLRDAAELNPYRTKYFLFVDSGHQCAGAQDPAFMNVYTEHMERGYLVTHWPYGTNSEVHGFNDKAMHVYVGTEKDPLRVVRGGIFGAKAQVRGCVCSGKRKCACMFVCVCVMPCWLVIVTFAPPFVPAPLCV